MGATSAAALRMRRSRERRRQGDVIVSLEVAPGAIADLVALGWLVVSDRGDKDALTRALVDLIGRAIELRVTPTTGWEGVCYAPLRVSAGPIAVGFDKSAGLFAEARSAFGAGRRSGVRRWAG